MRQLKITKSITNRESASLDKYLQEIGREDLITVEEEVELAQRIRKGDRVALEKLTRANLRFVVSVAKQYQNQGLSLPDLINEGNLGPGGGGACSAVLLGQSKIGGAASGGPVEQPVKQVDVAAQTVRRGVDGVLVSQLAQQTEQHAAGAGDELAPEGGQHAALKHIARLSGV